MALRTPPLLSKTLLNTLCVTQMKEIRRIWLGTTLRNDKRKSHTTVDAEDVARHSQLADDWWNPNGPEKALHAMNIIRVPFVRDGLVQCSLDERTSTPLKDKTILDVGCGAGILAEALARLGAKITGIDASKELILLAQQHSTKDPKLAENRPNYMCTNIEDHSCKHANHYDGVVASEIIEHVSDKELFVKSCIQALKPGGRIFFTTPNRTRLAQIAGIFIAEYVLKIVPQGTHQYEKFITPNELTFLLERNNCHVELINGMFYYFITNRWIWTKTQAYLFALQAVKLK